MSTEKRAARLPVFINESGGSAEQVQDALQTADALDIQALSATDLQQAIRQAVDDALPRIVVSGGDGTLAMAADLVRNTPTELAIIPGGTLNHFARRLQIPLEVEQAVQLALTGSAQPTMYATVNDRLFLNTSSVGAYVSFVKHREHLENTLPYSLASVLAALRRLWRFRRVNVTVNQTHHRTPLVFIGVGERELQLPDPGQNKTGGEAALHLMVLRCQNSLAALKVAVLAMLRGVDPISRTAELDHALLDTIELTLRSRHNRHTVALDGELVQLSSPLQYTFHTTGLNVVRPEMSGGSP